MIDLGDNAERIRRSHEAFTRGDVETALADFAADVVWRHHGRIDWGEVSGQDQIREAFRTWIGTFSEYRADAEEPIDRGDVVIQVNREVARGKGSGIEIDQPSITVYHFKDGLVVDADTYHDRDEALREAGL